jgi:hypothetical protein
MDFISYLDAVLRSEPHDWIVTSDPIGLQTLDQVEAHEAGGKVSRYVNVYGVDTIATLRSNLSIQLALYSGPRDQSPFSDALTDKFPDKSVTRYWVHMLWNGTTVYRDFILSVDGARALMPFPSVGGTSVPARQATFAELVDGLFSNGEFENYFQRAGLNRSSDRWPR